MIICHDVYKKILQQEQGYHSRTSSNNKMEKHEANSISNILDYYLILFKKRNCFD